MNNFVNNLFALEGLVVIVTGASRGIGAALADGLTQAGALVIGVARSSESDVSLLGSVSYRQCDITDVESFQGVCQAIYDQYNKINVLVNCAGIVKSPVHENNKLDVFNHIVQVNLAAQYSCMVAVREFIKCSGGGSIINVTSLGSVLGLPGNPGYVASKGGLRMLTKALAIDWSEDNIRVNNLLPGYIHTNMTNESYMDNEKHHQRMDRTILHRWGNPDDLIGAAIFLSSMASLYITGQDIIVDGGWTAKGL